MKVTLSFLALAMSLSFSARAFADDNTFICEPNSQTVSFTIKIKLNKKVLHRLEDDRIFAPGDVAQYVCETENGRVLYKSQKADYRITDEMLSVGPESYGQMVGLLALTVPTPNMGKPTSTGAFTCTLIQP